MQKLTIFLILVIFFNFTLASDKVKVVNEYDNFAIIKASTSFVKGTNVDEIKAKDGCIENAKLLASKKAYVHIYSEKEVINGALKKNIIKAISDNLLIIDSSKINRRISTNEAVIYDCSITARVKQNSQQNGYKNIIYPDEDRFIISNKKLNFNKAKEFCKMNKLRLPTIRELKNTRTTTVSFKDDSRYKFHIKQKYIPYMPLDKSVSFWSSTNREDFDDEFISLDFSMRSNNLEFYKNKLSEQYTMCLE